MLIRFFQLTLLETSGLGNDLIQIRDTYLLWILIT